VGQVRARDSYLARIRHFGGMAKVIQIGNASNRLEKRSRGELTSGDVDERITT
jgi:hypothetical protein